MAAMQRIYCQGFHGTGRSLCTECQSMLDYALLRLRRCRFGEEKPICAKCPVHCYQPAWRDAVKAVMRYAGPRMIWRHPILALRHMWDGYRSG